jgi:glycosyltransferase involved in cell wall biosynthesis
VDQFIANSRNVQNRIWKTYRQLSEIVYPPVAVESFWTGAPEDYFLIVSELVAYKRIDEAVRCFAKSGRRLKIAGGGPEYARLKKKATSNIEFCGRVSDEELRNLYAHCQALVLPGEEDFGMVPVEALASGKPVIALGRGGVLEAVPVAGPYGGLFYSEPGEHNLEAAVKEFERKQKYFSPPEELRSHAARFSKEVFQREMSNILFGPKVEETSSLELDFAIGLSR